MLESVCPYDREQDPSEETNPVQSFSDPDQSSGDPAASRYVWISARLESGPNAISIPPYIALHGFHFLFPIQQYPGFGGES